MLSLCRSTACECAARHPEESRSGEFEERKKGWRECDCQIFASGTLVGKFRPRSTTALSWDDAHH
jgi:hypothetical protein